MTSNMKSDAIRSREFQGHPAESGSGGRGSSVAAGTQMTGRLTSRTDLYFAGQLTGEIAIEGQLTVAAGASIEGPVVARTVSVAGGICGSVRGDERVEVVRGGSVSGDLVAACVVLGEGSEHDGRIELLYPRLS
jgi:cytoskeletal protein CcmA (bactofilin family)